MVLGGLVGTRGLGEGLGVPGRGAVGWVEVGGVVGEVEEFYLVGEGVGFGCRGFWLEKRTW